MTALPRSWAVLSVLVLGSGCVYYNGLYNARRLYDEGERARLAGQDSVARAAYREAGEKAERSYRAEPDGSWADDALYLLGRAQLRQGDLVRARGSLEEAVRRTDDPRVRLGGSLYLAVIALQVEDRAAATRLLNTVLRDVDDPELRAEGHLWRARLLLETGQLDAGWWDLDRAAEADDRYRVAAALERVAWGVVHGDGGRASAGAQTLLDSPAGYARIDTLEALVDRARDDWGAAAAADLLEGAEEAAWPPAGRDRLVLRRARLRADHGDMTAARRDAGGVASGAGPWAVEARLVLADLEGARAAAVEELALVRPVLLPAVEDARVLRRLEAIRTVQLLARRGREEPSRRVALFAGAEMARDVLAADGVATTLFLEYAERAPAAPWVGKALLAALGTAPDDARRRAILRSIAEHTDDPYIVLWRAGRLPEGRFEALEEGLRSAMASVLREVTAEARGMDLLLLQRADTLRDEGLP